MGLPDLGHGVGLRREHFDTIWEAVAEIDFFELLSENFMAFGGRPAEMAARAAAARPVVLHGVSLSIGSVDPLDDAEHVDRWLAAGHPGAVRPFHVSLAELEWAQFAVYADPTPVPDPDGCAAWVVNPTLVVLALAHPVVAWAVAHEDAPPTPETPPPSAREGGEVALVFRRPRSHRAWFVASDDLRFALAVAARGLTLGDAAAEAGQPVEAARAALARAVSLGLVLGPPPAA